MAPSMRSGSRPSAAEKQQIHKKIIEMLDPGTNDPLIKCFEDNDCDDDPIALVNIGDDEIADIEIVVKDDKGDEMKRKPPKAKAGRMRVLRNWTLHRKNIDNNFTHEDIPSLDSSDFDDFRTGTHAKHFINMNPPPLSSSGCKTHTKADLWKRGVKRDQTAHPKFQNEEKFEHWKREHESTAVAQGVGQALDDKHIPSMQDDTDELELVKQFIHATTTSCVLTNMGKKHVREHNKDKDGCEAWKKLVACCTANAKADTEIDDIMTFIGRLFFCAPSACTQALQSSSHHHCP